ncbi:hypothetical protein H8957_004699, partial [Semnopithecus entellus]
MGQSSHSPLHILDFHSPNLQQVGPNPLHLCVFFQKMHFGSEEHFLGRPSFKTPACCHSAEAPFPLLCPALLPHFCSGHGCEGPSQLPVL